MRNFSKIVCLLGGLTTVLVSGCAPLQPKTDLDASHRQSIHTIAVLDVTEPPSVAASNMGGAALAFGLIGGLVQAQANVSRAEYYTKRVAEKHVTFAPLMTSNVLQLLQADGYQVVSLKGQQPVLSDQGKMADFSGIHTDADAVLYVNFGAFGYLSQPNSTHFTPWVGARARLVDPKTHVEIYTKSFSCGWELNHNLAYVPAGSAYSYLTFDELLNGSFDQSIEGIQKCETDIASLIGQDLSRTASKDH